MTESTEATGRQYTGEEMRALLVAGGKYTGRLNIQGAVHLLAFIDDLVDSRDFADLVHVEQVDDQARGETYTAAFVPDWAELAGTRAAGYLGGGATRLLALAVSMATGAPVDLRENLSGFGHAYVRRVIEAVAIATGGAEFYTVTPTPALDRVLAFHAEMTGGAR